MINDLRYKKFRQSVALTNLFVHNTASVKRKHNEFLKKLINFLDKHFFIDGVKFYIEIFSCNRGIKIFNRRVCFRFEINILNKNYFDSGQMKLTAWSILSIIVDLIQMSYEGKFDTKK